MNTPQSWVEIGFEVEITGDGSPSLRLLQGHKPDMERGESMHHSGGAAEETELIYGRVIRHCFQYISSPHFLSVGLGLGYVELTVAREALLKKNMNFSLESFELVPQLKAYFMSWLKEEKLCSEVQKVYDQVLHYVLKDSPVSPGEIKQLLLRKLANQEWQMQGPLLADSMFMAKAHCLLFDAFSAKTSPDLWDEEFLVNFFKEATMTDALVSTYASRTALKRALKTAGFQVEVREGFKGKRNSTLALKGFFESTLELPGTSSHTQ